MGIAMFVVLSLLVLSGIGIAFWMKNSAVPRMAQKDLKPGNYRVVAIGAGGKTAMIRDDEGGLIELIGAQSLKKKVGETFFVPKRSLKATRRPALR